MKPLRLLQSALLGFWAGVAAASPTSFVDLNGNGMSDVWEVAFGWTGLPDGDDDGDGQSNFQESVAGTDPWDAASVFRLNGLTALPQACLLRWTSVMGKRYQVEASPPQASQQFQPVGEPVEGTGGLVTAAIPVPASAYALVRLRLLADNPAIALSTADLSDLDTDGDGMADIAEFAAGTDPFDPQSFLAAPDIRIGRAVLLRWPSVAGKQYQISSRAIAAGEPWRSEGERISGTGTNVTVALETEAAPRFYRVEVLDEDADHDGVSDWEEKMAGMDFGPLLYRTNHPTALSNVLARLAATNFIQIESVRPVANLTTGQRGGFRLTRTGNLNQLTVQYSVGGDAVAGSDYAPLTNGAGLGVITFPPGVNELELSVTPLTNSSLPLSRSVTLSLQPSPDAYVLGTNTTAEVRILKEVALSVRDFGAVGDGVSDDTAAIQAAIDALEGDTNYNTLHFPAGIYRLNTPTFRQRDWWIWNEALRLGSNDLAGRDLVFRGEPGAVLFSTISQRRTHMLAVNATFRSLGFRDLAWTKNSVALPQTVAEPNFAAGIFVYAVDARRVEDVTVQDCRFENCHPSVECFSTLFGARGSLAHFTLRNCQILNPYGSNTTNSDTIYYSGGQQVRLGTWVASALYEGNYFDGGASGEVDPVKNPGGVRKDGSHFGNPLHLLFTNNVVRRMAVEAVFQTDGSRVGTTAAAFVIPPADGMTAVNVALQRDLYSYTPGEILNFRVAYTITTPGWNALFGVQAFDPTNSILTVTNTGLIANLEGNTLPAQAYVCPQTYVPGLATVVGNRIELGEPRGGIGIAANAQMVIHGNYIAGYDSGIYIYENVNNPLNPPTQGLVVDGNVIRCRNSIERGMTTYGIISRGPGERVANNLVVTPIGYRFTGVVSRGNDSWIENNTIIPRSIFHQSYASAVRSVGIGFGNNTTGGTAAMNRTCGMDVGVGPEQAFQLPSHRVIGHFSTNDVLSVDLNGLTPDSIY